MIAIHATKKLYAKLPAVVSMNQRGIECVGWADERKPNKINAAKCWVSCIIPSYSSNV